MSFYFVENGPIKYREDSVSYFRFVTFYVMYRKRDFIGAVNALDKVVLYLLYIKTRLFFTIVLMQFWYW